MRHLRITPTHLKSYSLVSAGSETRGRALPAPSSGPSSGNCRAIFLAFDQFGAMLSFASICGDAWGRFRPNWATSAECGPRIRPMFAQLWLDAFRCRPNSGDFDRRWPKLDLSPKRSIPTRSQSPHMTVQHVRFTTPFGHRIPPRRRARCRSSRQPQWTAPCPCCRSSPAMPRAPLGMPRPPRAARQPLARSGTRRLCASYA